MSRAAWLVTFVAAFTFASSTAAFAYLQRTVTATGAAKAQQMLPPTSAPSATCVSSTTKKADISWSAVAHATGYTVIGTLTGTATAFATTTSSTSLTTSTLPSGSWTFSVETDVHLWTSGPGSSSATITISTSTPHCT